MLICGRFDFLREGGDAAIRVLTSSSSCAVVVPSLAITRTRPLPLRASGLDGIHALHPSSALSIGMTTAFSTSSGLPPR
jgi:hypothetical protein